MSDRSAQSLPDDAVLLERTFSLANDAMWAIGLQMRRIRPPEPEDAPFVFRGWVDVQFLIVALRRLRQISNILSSRIPEVHEAQRVFDRRLPQLLTYRNVGEHIDDYVLGKGRNKLVLGEQLQVGKWDGRTFEWLDSSLDVDLAHDAAMELFAVIGKAGGELASMSPPDSAGPEE